MGRGLKVSEGVQAWSWRTLSYYALSRRVLCESAYLQQGVASASYVPLPFVAENWVTSLSPNM
jgi:hypothetical protein